MQCVEALLGRATCHRQVHVDEAVLRVLESLLCLMELGGQCGEPLIALQREEILALLGGGPTEELEVLLLFLAGCISRSGLWGVCSEATVETQILELLRRH